MYLDQLPSEVSNSLHNVEGFIPYELILLHCIEIDLLFLLFNIYYWYYITNLYLSPFDHFVKEHLKLRHYLRYVDDFAAFSNDRQELADTQLAMEEFLTTLRLKMHPIKSQLFETIHGANFVGFQVLPDRIRVRNDNLRRARRRIKQLQEDYAVGKISLTPLAQRLQSWKAHLKHGDTHRLRRKVFDHYVFPRKEEDPLELKESEISTPKAPIDEQ